MEEFEKVSGSKADHDVKLYALSTCGWCKKTKQLLKDLDCEYEYIDVDRLEGETNTKIREQLKEHNPKMNLPTLVIDEGDEVIVGYKRDKIEEALDVD